ncbi:hypothetical protein LQ938_13160 [Microbacterium sp. cx-55]|nr:hypothetical protein [Microbacterium sp. cx-55]MBZ4487785.1 hypothetical protein [Microbacterium sp. cx-55]UGB34803.1 hypothetical protein LQ938_13160 [Microbacterium sp. cx-55]
MSALTSGAHVPAHVPCIRESSVLDVIYVAATLALFALVALVAKGVEKL